MDARAMIEDYKIQIKQILDSYKIDSTESLLNSLTAFVVNERIQAVRDRNKEIDDVIEGRA